MNFPSQSIASARRVIAVRRRAPCIALPVLLASVVWAIASASAASLATETPQKFAQRAPILMPVETRDGATQSALMRSSSWQKFRGRHGAWKALWNEATGTPHRAIGPSIALRGFTNDPAGVTQAVRAFIAANPEQFGGPDVTVENVSSSLHGHVWYVRFRQTVGGLPVLYSDWEFRVGTNGRLMMFGADPRSVPADLRSRAVLPAPVAREAAHLGISFDLESDHVDLAPRMAYVPIVRPDGGADLRLVYDATIRPARRGADQRVLIDACNGALLLRQPLRADAVTGTVTADIHPSTAYDPLVTRPLRNVTVNATVSSTASTITDTTGHYSVTAPGTPCTITTDFTGPYCTIVRVDGPGSGFNRANVADPSAVNVAWTALNSQDAERDAFYHVNLAHDWVKEIDQGFTASDYSLQVFVNWNDGLDCEAYWDPPTNSLNFWPAGECPNTATMPDLVWHEYAHMVNYRLYYSFGSANGVENQTLREGMADAASVMMGGQPLVGIGFNGPGTFLRDVRAGARYPESESTDPHNAGLIFAGAMWDFRSSTFGFAPLLARTLLQLAKYGLPDDLDDGVAMSEFFVDLLVADDNDFDLGNLTPNFGVINTAFSAHGIGMNYFLSLAHTPLGDQPSIGPYPITATVSYGGPIGALASVKLFYQASGVPWTAKTMLPTGNPDEFGAQIPKYYGIVRYYLQITDSYGGTAVLPGGAPTRLPYQFFAGPASTVASNTMEAPDGWVVGYASDTPVATTGTWVRAVPVQSSAQPGADHTPAGTQCWVTGNAPLITDPPGINDIDGGKTTLVTTTFNGTPAGIVYPVISYWRWYSNNVGDSPNEDPWRVFISNNGGTSWSRVENTTNSSLGWERVMFAISDYVTPTNNMKMRFVAQDTSNLSIVEAAVDDWKLLGLPSTLDVSGPQSLTELMLQPVWPNPAEGDAHMRFTLPTAGRVELRVYDIEGREVRTLINGDRPPGSQSALWDGRDDAGRRVASGPYFVRLTRGNREVVSRAVVMLR